MLALRLVLLGVDGDADRTLVFDEVDAGIGGTAAGAVGRALAEVARRHQVLVVTHLAQVAALATAQVVVRKHVVGGRRRRTAVAVVDGDDRVAELARMLSGAEGGAAARRHAAELLVSAEPAPGDRRTLLVDGGNVLGAGASGWWRDRPAAMRRLADRLSTYAGRADVAIELVLDAPDLPAGAHDGIVVQHARRRGRDAADDRIRELLAERDPAPIDVVTSDRGTSPGRPARRRRRGRRRHVPGPPRRPRLLTPPSSWSANWLLSNQFVDREDGGSGQSTIHRITGIEVAMTPSAMPSTAVRSPGWPLRRIRPMASSPRPMAIGPRMTPKASRPAGADQQPKRRRCRRARTSTGRSGSARDRRRHGPSLSVPGLRYAEIPTLARPSTSEVHPHAEAHLRDGWRGQLARQGSHRLLARSAAQAPRAAGHDAEARPVHQRRPRHDEPVRARRGVRHRRRRRDRPRPRPLRAVHRREPVAGLERHDRARSTSRCSPPSAAATTSARPCR